MRCHFITDEETGMKILIPGCWGTAFNYGYDDLRYCTCYKPIFKKTKEQKISDLEDECNALRAINAQLNSANRKLLHENRDLKYRGLPLHLRRKIEQWDDNGKTTLWAFIQNMKNPFK